LLAVRERGFEIGIVLSVLGDCAADLATEEDFGFAVRANCSAGFGGCPINHLLNREVMPSHSRTQNATEWPMLPPPLTRRVPSLAQP
jgi:hypothetical protein